MTDYEHKGKNTWLNLWSSILVSPSPEKFSSLIQQPDATARKGLIWLFSTGMLMGMMWIVNLFFLFMILVDSDVNIPWLTLIVLACITIPVAGLVVVLYLLGNISIYHFVATNIEGTGTYHNMIYAMSIFTAPILLISTLLLFIPYLGWLIIYVVSLYHSLLTVMAVRGVYRISWMASILIVSIPMIISQILITALQLLIIFSIFGGLIALSNP